MKQAVVLIHGIGEQVPMDTLRGFVEAIWEKDLSLRRPNVPAQSWSKPDQVSGDFELRRLTTAENREGRRTDFFEFYWAHLMEGTQVGHLLAWARLLLFRSPASVPKQLRGLWWYLVLSAIAVGVGIVAFYVYGGGGWLKSLLSLAGSAFWLFIGAFIVKKVAGDAARYLHVAPPNIESRHRIRAAGVALLEKLHQSGKYDRIIVAGHSLGSVIGYDLLTHYWAQCHDKFGAGAPRQEVTKLEALETLAREPAPTPDFVHIYQEAQSEYFAELKAASHPWLVTDFVTMGSPLAHAALLLGRTEKEFKEKKAQREFPTCPPELEEVSVNKKRVCKFTFFRDPQWIPHHAAVFAPTRWTNLYFPCTKTIWGDVIGGPLVPAFGPGVRDMPVETDLQGGLFTHNLYWELPPSSRENPAPWISGLREAVRICETPAPPPPSAVPAAMEPVAAELNT